ncbi:hypothetical protein GGR54DRAFT_480202 [Hypoxylon sp. NC1633]|nr:hypothetical protein GGR54DRAFT_480202 [Hypoxylon sp. NC1633]
MITKRSRQHREAFCRQAKRRKVPPRSSSIHARETTRNPSHQDHQDNMLLTTLSSNSLSRHYNSYARSTQAIPPPSLPSANIFEHTTASSSLISRPANQAEIYGLTLGICFLALLMGWLLFVGIRASIRPLAKTPREARRIADPEIGDMLQGLQSPDENRSFLSGFRNTVMSELVNPARRKSGDVAAGLKFDLNHLRMMANPIRRRDEEAALETVGWGAAEPGGPFLRRPHRAAVALPV